MGDWGEGRECGKSIDVLDRYSGEASSCFGNTLLIVVKSSIERSIIMVETMSVVFNEA